jgi:indolepyruvate decarboxylase
VVFNNRSWEMLRVFQPESRFNDLHEVKFTEIADAMGGAGRRVSTRAELFAALEEAVADAGCFRVLDVTLARGAISRTLSRYVEGFRQKPM